MIPSLRWFGPSDPVGLDDIRAAGAHAVVTALHSVPNGQAWSRAAIDRRIAEIESAGPSESGKALRWAVVESVPVHEAIKLNAAGAEQHIEAFAKTVTNLGRTGIRTVCYNFMPILDWTRTDLAYPLANGSLALRFSQSQFDAFELFELDSERASSRLSADRIERATEWYSEAGEEQRQTLTAAIAAGLPGSEESYTLDGLRDQLKLYSALTENDLRGNLVRFLDQVTPAAEDAGVELALHPDDPPWALLGLPRVASTAADYREIFSAVPSRASGMTFCSGSLGARSDNDLESMITEFSSRIRFVHLRNVVRESHNGFHEAHHLAGDIDMPRLLELLLTAEDRSGSSLVYRPDHGALTPLDSRQDSRAGYAYVGRLRGLAELQGALRGLQER